MIFFVVVVHRSAAFQNLSGKCACRIGTEETWGVTVLMLLAKIRRTEAFDSTGTIAVVTEI